MKAGTLDRVEREIRRLFDTDQFIPLHEPRFWGNEKQYVNEAIDSTFVSSVGKFVDQFEREVEAYTGAARAVAVVNGTAALHMALLLAGVKPGDEVITRPLTFVATANAIRYCQAEPVFLDVDRDTLGLSPDRLEEFLERHAELRDDGMAYNRRTGRRLAACVPMHTFGLPARVERLVDIAGRFGIPVVEDAAESLGSLRQGRHTGTFGRLGVLSFNGNKTITTGGGGMVITNDAELGKLAKHLTTTAKLSHPWEYVHDHVGYNYRLPNLNAALGVAQMEQLPRMVGSKRALAEAYRAFFASIGVEFLAELPGDSANYWLNAIVLDDFEQREHFLKALNARGVMCRPIWRLMNRLPMFAHCQTDSLENALWLEQRVVNIPSSARP